MTEELEEYVTKTITAKDMLIITGGASHQKIIENNHKESLLALEPDYLFERLGQELQEFKDAFDLWEENPTDKNKKEVLREWADCNNFGSAIVMKTDGYTELIRE